MKYKKLYVVGYLGKSEDAVYSKEAWAFDDKKGGKYGGVGLMTLPAAKKHIKSLGDPVLPKAIFKLTPVIKFKN